MGQQAREQWGTRAGFLMAAIGSAIGLGNIWRFPYVAYDNGGGAFLIPYLIALLTAGIPLLILEYSIGHRYRSSAPLSYRRIYRPAEAIGWWQVAICFVIAVYYAVIVAWAIRYAGFSIGQQWGDDPNGFFFEEFLQISDTPGMVSGFVSGVAWPLIAVWVVVLGILALGVRKGIEKANKVFIPLLVVLFVLLVAQSLTLEGASEGLNALFTPDWSAMLDGGVWIAAYGQIFFSLSIGFAIMVTYASYLKRKTDLTGTALTAGFANSSFELLAGIGVFAALGFMANAAGTGVDEVAASGIGLAFVAFPQIISTLPFGGALFGLLFFVSLVIAGITSLISIVQVIISAVQDRTGLARVPTVLLVGGATAVASILLFPTHEGLYILDSFDHFINQYGIAMAGLVMILVFGWLVRRLPVFERHANAVSTIRLDRWWKVALGGITPILLGFMMWDSLRSELTSNYEDYPDQFLLVAGWGVAIGAIVFGIIVACFPWKRADAIARADAERLAGAEDAEVPPELDAPDRITATDAEAGDNTKEGDR
ncbi:MULTISPECIES: sodium-dependent transporter [Nocardiopsis]|uniref:Transporter n=1 Tax=Nocardiopsis alba TaxID=53437 RepID=A0A7K2IZF7_9ACTN|nr:MULTISPECIES: sodium-dependent transporter [Nocardiopsis]MEC3891286.1 sodium-dependent transporter [Nocardiopsis sp. LDBS1602]MYR35361.1 sodium-dependent transporter [Nocardiopsis alba]